MVVYRRHLSHVDRAICDNAQEGLIKIICHKNLQILGATIVAPVAGEMISEIAVMMKAKMSFDKLATVMHPYPVSEYSHHGQYSYFLFWKEWLFLFRKEWRTHVLYSPFGLFTFWDLISHMQWLYS